MTTNEIINLRGREKILAILAEQNFSNDGQRMYFLMALCNDPDLHKEVLLPRAIPELEDRIKNFQGQCQVPDIIAKEIREHIKALEQLYDVTPMDLQNAMGLVTFTAKYLAEEEHNGLRFVDNLKLMQMREQLPQFTAMETIQETLSEQKDKDLFRAVSNYDSRVYLVVNKMQQCIDDIEKALLKDNKTFRGLFIGKVQYPDEVINQTKEMEINLNKTMLKLMERNRELEEAIRNCFYGEGFSDAAVKKWKELLVQQSCIESLMSKIRWNQEMLSDRYNQFSLTYNREIKEPTMNSRLSKLLAKYSLEKVPYACEIFDIGYKMDQEDSWLLGVKNVFDFLDTHAYPLLMESERLLHYDLKSVTKDFNQDILENQLAAPGHVLNGKKVEERGILSVDEKNYVHALFMKSLCLQQKLLPELSQQVADLEAFIKSAERYGQDCFVHKVALNEMQTVKRMTEEYVKQLTQNIQIKDKEYRFVAKIEEGNLHLSCEEVTGRKIDVDEKSGTQITTYANSTRVNRSITIGVYTKKQAGEALQAEYIGAGIDAQLVKDNKKLESGLYAMSGIVSYTSKQDPHSHTPEKDMSITLTPFRAMAALDVIHNGKKYNAISMDAAIAEIEGQLKMLGNIPIKFKANANLADVKIGSMGLQLDGKIGTGVSLDPVGTAKKAGFEAVENVFQGLSPFASIDTFSDNAVKASATDGKITGSIKDVQFVSLDNQNPPQFNMPGLEDIFDMVSTTAKEIKETPASPFSLEKRPSAAPLSQRDFAEGLQMLRSLTNTEDMTRAIEAIDAKKPGFKEMFMKNAIDHLPQEKEERENAK